MRFHIYLIASIAMFAFFSLVNGEEAKPAPQGQLRLLITFGDMTPTITRPRDDQASQKGEMIVSCDSMTFDQGAYVFKNGALEMTSGNLSFKEIAVTFSERSISFDFSKPNNGLKEIHFQLKPGEAMPKVLTAPAPR